MVFKKMCFECGAKVEKLYEGKCIDCYKEEFLPIKEIKETNLKICNQCGRIHYNNGLYSAKEIEEMISMIVQKRIVLHDKYKLNSLSIENFELRGSKISFDVEVDCDLK